MKQNPGDSSELSGPSVVMLDRIEKIRPQAEEAGGLREEHRSSRLFNAICILVLFVVASAASFSCFYEKWHFRETGTRGDDPIASFDRMIDGTANRPYVYRQLLPDVANFITHTLPLSAVSPHLPARAKQRISIAFNLQSKRYPVQYLVVYILTYLSALLAAFALYLFCRATNMLSPAAVFAPVVFLLLFPLIGVKGGYFFDYPELLFMAATAWMALRFEWWWLIPVAALGAWNKESFLLFTFTLYPLLRRRYSRMVSLIGVGVLAAVCAAVYLPLRLHFAHNPGGTVEWHFKDQISFYLHPFSMDTWVDRTYDLMFPALSSPLPTLFLIWMVWRSWRYLPTWLKRNAQIAAVINVPLYLLFCQPGEYRDLSLLYVSFFTIIAVGLQRWIDSSTRSEAVASVSG